jgi:hypothetical protein
MAAAHVVRDTPSATKNPLRRWQQTLPDCGTGTKEGNHHETTDAGLATTALVSGGVAAVLGAGTAQADDGGWGPPHRWCPGQSLWITGNHVNNPVIWDNNVCHTYYIVYSGLGNVAQNIWDGPNPPPKPPRPVGLNFCPIPPWCP